MTVYGLSNIVRFIFIRRVYSPQSESKLVMPYIINSYRFHHLVFIYDITSQSLEQSIKVGF